MLRVSLKNVKNNVSLETINYNPKLQNSTYWANITQFKSQQLYRNGYGKSNTSSDAEQQGINYGLEKLLKK